MRPIPVIAVCGPTAVGKTAYAIEIARALDGEIVSCDSMQLYQFMDIGSAKPTPEEQAAARHHLVDCIDPREPFSAARYEQLAKEAIREIAARGKTPVVCGGTGLYFNALVYKMDFGMPPGERKFREDLLKFAEKEGPEALVARLRENDPAAADRIDPHNTRKLIRAIETAERGGHTGDFSKDPQKDPAFDYWMIGLARDRAELYDRINRRADLLMEAGLVEEVRSLLAMGLTADDISMKGIGYKEIIGYLNGEYDEAEAVELLKKNTRHFAKRQMTWFRRYPEMHWYNISSFENDAACLAEILADLRAARKEENEASL